MRTTYQECFINSTPSTPVIYHTYIPRVATDSKKKPVLGYQNYISATIQSQNRKHKKTPSNAVATSINHDLTIKDTPQKKLVKKVNASLTEDKYAQQNPQKKHAFEELHNYKIEEQQKPRPTYAPSPIYIKMNDKLCNPLHRDPNSRLLHK